MSASQTRIAKGEIGTQADWNLVSMIYRALDSWQVSWLRSNDFVTPWLDPHARRIMDIEPLVTDVVDAPLEPELLGALRLLSGALEAFGEFYAHNTIPDPLLLGEAWRFFEWDEPGATEEAHVEADWSGRAAHLHLLATELADAYEGFTAIAARYPNVRERVEVRA
jgi:hypothetical protein